MPTIQVPQNLDHWAQQLTAGDVIIIAGNEVTPHDAVRERLNTASKQYDAAFIYLHPDDVKHYRINQFMEPNHHHRRNFALLKAIELNTDVIITVDDDNFPNRATHVEDVTKLVTHPVVSKRPDVTMVSTNTKWWDPGTLCAPRTTHRGYPLSQRNVDPIEQHFTLDGTGVRVGVVASLWTGDPDIDAIERIANDPQVEYITCSRVVATDTWCPFDSQSTTVRGDLAPLLFMWPYVGRYDDIWASYMMRIVMNITGDHVMYGHPAVYQERNPHNLLSDLDKERLGYEYTEELFEWLRSAQSDIARGLRRDDMAPWNIWCAVVAKLARDALHFIPRNTINAMIAWVADVNTIITQRGE